MVDRPVQLSALLNWLPASTLVNGDTARPVTGIALDSRAVRPGEVFVAVRGVHADGHAFITQAVSAGARAVVVEAPFASPLPPEVTVVVVRDTRRALAVLAAEFYGNPSRVLDVIGVTGTNGKTTTTRMIAAILNRSGRRCGVIGTVGALFGATTQPVANTTPLPPELQRLLAWMRDAGASSVAMEVSSHALALDRVEEVTFRIAVLTNVARDHLDFHGTLESYAAAKRKLLAMAQTCVVNGDDPFGARWAQELQARGVDVTTFGEGDGARIVPTSVEVTGEGSRFRIGAQAFELRIPGRFNVANAAAAIGVARALGVDDVVSAAGLAGLEGIPGRMERVRGDGVDVVVDYAHTPDALENALRSLRETASGTLAVVFGCGGERDRGKRPEMGAIAARYADRVYVTNDNPRTEEPSSIAAEIVAGIASRACRVELDRKRAIELAIDEAAAGDVVLIAGKGHEAYQVIGDQVFAFDDVAVAREALARRGAMR
jgi:UDP-N-acetylmuramoyl-L-alanyl-D-glutamate--2,6-diaminopimelate ligase